MPFMPGADWMWSGANHKRILPVDQHTNEIANEIFARSLAPYLVAELITH
jgi:hypothetical protein